MKKKKHGWLLVDEYGDLIGPALVHDLVVECGDLVGPTLVFNSGIFEVGNDVFSTRRKARTAKLHDDKIIKVSLDENGNAIEDLKVRT